MREGREGAKGRNGTEQRSGRPRPAGQKAKNRTEEREEGRKGGSAAGRVNSESGREMAPVLLCLAPATSSPSIESTLIINAVVIVPMLKVSLLQIG